MNFIPILIIDSCANSSENGILAKIDELNEEIRLSGLDGVSFSADCGEVAMIDDIDGLMGYSMRFQKTTIVKIMMLGIGRTRTASSANFCKQTTRLKSIWARLIRNMVHHSVQLEH